MEPQLKTVKNYYQEKSKNNLRIKEFDTTNSIKLARDIKDLVRMQVEAIELINREKHVIHKDGYSAHKFACFEHAIDKKYKELVAFYLAKGIKANREHFRMFEQDRPDKAGLKFKDLLAKARSERNSAIKEDNNLTHNISVKNITPEKLDDLAELASRK
jgi:hypothetical protein